jgi:hypothetical protein
MNRSLANAEEPKKQILISNHSDSESTGLSLVHVGTGSSGSSLRNPPRTTARISIILSLFFAMVCTRGDDTGFAAHGRLRIQVFDNSVLLIDRLDSFDVVVKSNIWRFDTFPISEIDQMPLLKGFARASSPIVEGLASAFDGSYIYSVLSPTTNHGICTGTIGFGPVPYAMDESIVSLWIAFGSGRYLQSNKTASIDAFSWKFGTQPYTTNLRTRAEWTFIDSAAALPQNIRFHNYNSHLAAEYTVCAVSNFGGVPFPAKMELRRYAEGGTNVTRLISYEVFSASTSPTKPVAVPALAKQAHVEDVRTYKMNPPSRSISLASATWPSLETMYRYYEQKIRATPGNASFGNKRSNNYVPLILLAIVVAAGIFILLWRKRQQPTRN